MKAIIPAFCLVFIPSMIFSQNVGIGTTTPLTKLHVSGTGDNIAIFSGGSQMYITLAEGLNNRGYIGSFSGNPEDVDFGTYAGNPGKVHLTTANTPRLTVLSNGNVGIGTVIPEQLFSVQSGMVVDQGNTNTGTVANTIRFGSSSGEAIGSKRSAGANQYGIDFYTQSLQRMTITNGGNVGIGTTNPQSKLDVNGDINIGNKLLLNNTTGNAGQVLVSGGPSASASWQNTAYGNSDRFLYYTYNNIAISANFNDTLKFITSYSLSSAITLNTTTGVFTVNKSGFYRLEGAFNVSGTWSSSQNGYTSLYLTLSPVGFFVLAREMVSFAPSGPYFFGDKTLPVGITLYLSAGNSFYFQGSMGSGGTPQLMSFDTYSPLSIFLVSE